LTPPRERPNTDRPRRRRLQSASDGASPYQKLPICRRHRLTPARRRITIRAIRVRSSTGQSVGLRSRRLWVRAPPDAWVAYLHSELGSDLGDLPAIIRHWKSTAASISKPSTVFEMVAEYLVHRGRDMKAKTLADIRHRCLRFSSMFHGRKVHEIAAADIRAFLDSRDHSTSRRNDYKALSPMFRWAREKGMLLAILS
jgi:hypothetical protein